MSIQELWQKLIDLQGKPFETSGRCYANKQMDGTSFTFTIKGRSVFFDRKVKPVTWSSVERALANAEKVQKEEGYVKGPKSLGVFGASYLYAVFEYIGIIRTGKGREERKPWLYDENRNSGTKREDSRQRQMKQEKTEENSMPRPKGTKNKSPVTFEEQIARLDGEIARLKEEIERKQSEREALVEKQKTAKKSELRAAVEASGLSMTEIMEVLEGLDRQTEET